MKTIMKYACALIGAAALGFLLLYLAGLMPQQVVRQNVRESAAQYEAEGKNPKLLYAGNTAYQMDDYSDSLILKYSLYMDTQKDPLSVLSNPAFEVAKGQGDGVRGLKIITETETPKAPNTNYVRYFMGFRALVRPLLTVLNYMQIRQLLMWTVSLLGAGVLLMLARRIGTLCALLFAASFLAMNPVIVVNSMQFSCCFLIAFVGMLLMPRVKDVGFFTAPMAFFLLGAATQYFDFYTTPVLTYGLPMITLLLLRQRQGLCRQPRESFSLMGKCFLAWGIAYVGMWQAKLLATELVAGYPAFSSAFGQLRFWTSVDGGGWLRQTADNLLNCLFAVRTPESIVFTVLFSGAWLLALLKGRTRGRIRGAACYLALGALPYVWILCSITAIGRQYFYQYRILMVFLFALCAFFVSTTGKTTEKECGET